MRLGTHRFQRAGMAEGLLGFQQKVFLDSKRFTSEVSTLEAMRTQAFSWGDMNEAGRISPSGRLPIVTISVSTSCDQFSQVFPPMLSPAAVVAVAAAVGYRARARARARADGRASSASKYRACPGADDGAATRTPAPAPTPALRVR